MSDPVPFHTLPRLYVEADLRIAQNIELSQEHTHYLGHVLRISEGESIRLFNGRDGEWLGAVFHRGDRKHPMCLEIKKKTRDQVRESDLYLMCAPIKKAHFDDVLMKSTELGVTHIQPILTARTQIREVNTERCRSIVVEAAEQSERLALPEVLSPISLEKLAKNWPVKVLPVVCAEWGEATPIKQALAFCPASSAGILTGPEGGFTADELGLLKSLPRALAVRLGPRILRADTAALAALTCWQALCGDWNKPSE